MSRRRTAQALAGRRWVAVGLVGAVACLVVGVLALLPGCLPWTTHCSGSGASGGDSALPTTETDQGASTGGVPFDPPSRFGFAEAVPLTQDEALHGTLHGTMLYSVVDSSLRATDLVEHRRLWSVELSAADYLAPPVVVGDVVVVATGKKDTSEGAKTGDYVITMTGVSLSSSKAVWETPISLYSSVFSQVEDGINIGPSDQWFGLKFTERDVGLLVAVGPFVYPPTTVLLDPSTGGVLWSLDMTVAITASGRYGIGSRDYQDASVVDLGTGGVIRRLTVPSTYDSMRGPYTDPQGDGSYVVVGFQDHDSPQTYVRFSSVDGTTQPFVPAEGDVRYDSSFRCSLESGQQVALCRSSDKNETDGVDPATGEVVWTSAMDNATQFHGNVYGGVGITPVVVSLRSGVTLQNGTGFLPVYKPILVNEYGAVGIPCASRDKCMLDQYVWAPASG